MEIDQQHNGPQINLVGSGTRGVSTCFDHFNKLLGSAPEADEVDEEIPTSYQ